MIPRPVLEGERVQYDVDLGLDCDGCGKRHRRIRRAAGEVLSVDGRRRRAWILLEGEVHPRSVPLNELRPGVRKDRCAWS